MGGPLDGWYFSVDKRYRNIIVPGPGGYYHEYIDRGVIRTSPRFVHPLRDIFSGNLPKHRLIYSGWLRPCEVAHARRLAGR